MEKAILKLAAYLLKEYGDMLSNNGCNDTTEEVYKMIDEIGEKEFQKICEEWNNGECENGKDYDWIVAKAIGYKLKKIAEAL